MKLEFFNTCAELPDAEPDKLFGMEIECDKADGYRYFIRRDRYADTEISEWLLSSLRMASLGDMLKYHSKVMLEKAPENTQFLDDIISAIDKHLIFLS